MDNNAKIKWKKALPSICMLVFIAILVGLSFLPCFRGNKTPVAATAADVDGEATRVLGCCAAYAYSNDFETVLNGKINARVFGVPYTLSVRGGRSVRVGAFEDVMETVSLFIKAGIKKSGSENGYSVSKGEYTKGGFVYGDGTTYEKAEYAARYGKPAVGLTKYDLDNSVIGAQALGDNVFKFVLDPSRATVNCRNEIKTILDLSSYPEYESVEVTLYSDGERAVKVTCEEIFRIEKFGGASCRAEYTEVFDYKV